MKENDTRPRIIICEDEPMIAMHLAALVEEAGCAPVGPFSSGRDALSALRSARIDAAILDVDLADGASTPLAGALREAGVRILVLSGIHMTAPPPEFSGLEWMLKPADEDRLRAFCIGAVVEARRRTVSEQAPGPAL